MAILELRFVDGPHREDAYSFDRPLVILGRNASNDLCIKGDTGVSGDHAKLSYENGSWFVEDCGSTNGTFVKMDDAFVRVRGQIALASGQTIKLGRSQILVSFGGEAMNTVVEADPQKRKVEVHSQANAIIESGMRTSGQRGRQLLRVELVDNQLRYEFASRGAIGVRSRTNYNSADIEHLRGRLLDLAFRSRQHAAALQVPDKQKLHEELQDIGTLLAHMVFPKRIRTAIADVGPQSLFFVHTAALIGIPWELAVIGLESIGTQFSFGRQVMLDQNSSLLDLARVSELPIERPRLLIVCNPTGDLGELESKTESLLEDLQRANSDWHIEFVARDRVERLDLLERLSRSDFVYYIGHAEYDPQTPANSGWLLKDGRLTCQDIRRLPHSPVAVFANGCETGREADWDEGGSLRDKTFGLASAFLLSGVQCYIGTSWPISPASAATFARVFFEELAGGGYLGQCVRHARIETREACGEEDLTWAGYVMYGDPAMQFCHPADKDT